MSRCFTDPHALLADLLDRHEAGTASPIAYPDYAAFASVVATDAFIKELRQAEETGAVSIAYGKGSRRDQVAHVRLQVVDALYRHLDRKPIGRIAADARSRLIEGLTLHAGLADAASAIASGWGRAKSWYGFAPDDAEKLRNVFLLAHAILDGRHQGVDYRTFSRRVTGDSKMLERMEGPVVRLLGGILDLPPGAKPREALRTLGLEKFAPPLLISGRVDLTEADLSLASPLYLGIPPNEATCIRFRELPAYLLTIENFASFNRHIIEADPNRLGATIYVGGYPSLATQRALRILALMLPTTVPVFHWSDIDADGTWIFRTIERAVGRALRPHLMSSEIAERLGKACAEKSDLRPCPRDSGIFSLTEYLARDGARTLEQEELDPQLPDIDLGPASVFARAT
ncbi:MAG TPA: Wadjet anti-phage system protein JetD domain-containing protein [Xanthobacteraceae bacterium]